MTRVDCTEQLTFPGFTNINPLSLFVDDHVLFFSRRELGGGEGIFREHGSPNSLPHSPFRLSWRQALAREVKGSGDIGIGIFLIGCLK